MPRFTFEAMDGQGKTVKDEVEAVTQEEAISRIRRLGYFPTSIREKVARGAARRAVAPGKRKALAFGGYRGSS